VGPEPPLSQEAKTVFVFSAIVEAGQIHSDLMGHFLTSSCRSKKYVIVLFAYDPNTIITDPMKNHGDREMVIAYDVLIIDPTPAPF
jgi:hypothetical protein